MNPSLSHAATIPASPCGPSLEYDPDYLLLLARLAPRAEVQYGGFITAPEPPDWNAVEREAERLLGRSIDIALLVCQCRSATHLRRAVGLASALGRLLDVLTEWPDAVHPRLLVDGVRDPAVRANALAALADPDGLLGDISRLLSQPSDATDVAALADAFGHAQALYRWAEQTLDEQAPVLRPLLDLLQPFARPANASDTADTADTPERLAVHRCEEQPPRPVDVPAQRAGGPNAHARPLQPWPFEEGLSRADMRTVIAHTRAWFETHEPSSPVALVLGRAESMVGLRYDQLVRALPDEWLKPAQASAGSVVSTSSQALR